jgi:hypothetical protein
LFSDEPPLHHRAPTGVRGSFQNYDCVDAQHAYGLLAHAICRFHGRDGGP